MLGLGQVSFEKLKGSFVIENMGLFVYGGEVIVLRESTYFFFVTEVGGIVKKMSLRSFVLLLAAFLGNWLFCENTLQKILKSFIHSCCMYEPRWVKVLGRARCNGGVEITPTIKNFYVSFSQRLGCTKPFILPII